MISLVISGAAATGVILLLSLAFTRYQIKQMMRPVNALTQAAHRVEAGDYSTPVDYEAKDEFSTVCTAFDHMQEHLLQEREKTRCMNRRVLTWWRVSLMTCAHR